MSAILHYPAELLSLICAQVYAAGLPPLESSLDPLILGEYGAATALPSSLPPGHWQEPVMRRTFTSLCLVSHAWYQAAKPWLWRRVEVRLPRSWLALVEEIAGGDEDAEDDSTVEESIQTAARAVIAATSSLGTSVDRFSMQELRESVTKLLVGPDGSIPPELLSPPATRDPSPKRIRAKSKSPARWKIMRSISDAVQNVLEKNGPGVYVPIIHDPHPGRFVHHIDFNHFRTIGMRRSIEEGVNSRFVTGGRIEAVLKETPNLVSFGATEYMDGALTLPVLEELFLRGLPSQGRGRHSRNRIPAMTDNDIVDEDRERRQKYKALEAADLTGCVSAVFVHALTQFVNTHLVSAYEKGDNSYTESPLPRSSSVKREEVPSLLGLCRLGLRGVKSIQPEVLTPFVLAFPSLTHLDLSGTRITHELLSALGQSSVRLQSLALARCIRLTGESIKIFLIDSPAASKITELCLYGDRTFPSPLSEADLAEMFDRAPCLTSGKLVYLDLSSAPITADLLTTCKPQPNLRSLGLSNIPDLDLEAITKFMETKAENVEVLALVSTSPQLEWARADAVVPAGSVRQASLSLHTKLIRPLCTSPFSFSLSSPSIEAPDPPTRLRVIELSVAMLGGLGAGAGSWRIVRSKGGRGWYVDTASGWVGGKLKRNLDKEHPLRVEMEKLADANGNVNSGVGWHARKMEVLHGSGMLGREDGLYGAVSFAYQG